MLCDSSRPHLRGYYSAGPRGFSQKTASLLDCSGMRGWGVSEEKAGSKSLGAGAGRCQDIWNQAGRG